MMAEIDLQPFCSTDPFRPGINHPFSRGDWTYATDGIVLVRVPRREDVEEFPGAPHAERVIDGIPLLAAMKPLPAFVFPEPDKEICRKCDGRGSVHDCPDCNCECSRCRGSGSAPLVVTGAIGGTSYDARYLKLIAGLPQTRVPVSPPPRRDPMRFTFEGGEGLLCGYDGASHKHVPDPSNHQQNSEKHDAGHV